MKALKRSSFISHRGAEVNFFLLKNDEFVESLLTCHCEERSDEAIS